MEVLIIHLNFTSPTCSAAPSDTNANLFHESHTMYPEKHFHFLAIFLRTMNSVGIPCMHSNIFQSRNRDLCFRSVSSTSSIRANYFRNKLSNSASMFSPIRRSLGDPHRRYNMPCNFPLSKVAINFSHNNLFFISSHYSPLRWECAVVHARH